MILSIDYDGTWDADPQLFAPFDPWAMVKAFSYTGPAQEGF